MGRWVLSCLFTEISFQPQVWTYKSYCLCVRLCVCCVLGCRCGCRNCRRCSCCCSFQSFQLDNGIPPYNDLSQILSRLFLFDIFQDNIQKGIVSPQGPGNGPMGIQTNLEALVLQSQTQRSGEPTTETTHTLVLSRQSFHEMYTHTHTRTCLSRTMNRFKSGPFWNFGAMVVEWWLIFAKGACCVESNAVAHGSLDGPSLGIYGHRRPDDSERANRAFPLSI